MSENARITGLVGNSAIKVPVRAASTAALTLSAEQTVDGVALVSGDRVLVKDQASSVDNGVYVVDTGSWERSKDSDGSYDFVQGSFVFVYGGTQNGSKCYQQTTAAPVVGTDSLVFTQALFSSLSGASFLQAGTGAVSRTAQDKMRDIVSIFDFMTTAQIADVQAGTASVDLHTPYAAAVLAARGGNIWHPKGQYLLNTDSGTITLEEVGLVGEFVLDDSVGAIDKGSVLRFTGTTNSPFLVRTGTEFRSMGFYYPNQTDSATPVAYPPTLDFDFSSGEVEFVYVDGCVVYNAYRFCRINSTLGDVGHCWFTNNTIYGIHRCFEITYHAEVIHIEGNDFTFGHWNASTEAGCRGYTRANGYIIEWNRGDGLYVSDNLGFGYLRGISAGSGGVLCQFLKYSNNDFDQVRYGLYLTGAGNFTDIGVDNSTFVPYNSQNTALDGNMLFMDNSGAGADQINISNVQVGSCTADCIVTSGNAPTRLINVSGGNFKNFGAFKAAGNYHGINASGSLTSVYVNGTRFSGANNAFTNGIGGTLNVLSVNNCVFDSCSAVFRSVTATTCIHTGNVSFATVGATSDVITATNNWNVGNKYDKASGTTTRPAFLTTTSAATSFNGAAADCPFATEVFDKGGNFATPSFTAPMTGMYQLTVCLTHDNAVVAADVYQIDIVTSNRTYSRRYYAVANVNNAVTFGVLADMDISDTAKVQVTRVSGTGAFTLNGQAAGNFFSGHLVE